MYSKSKKLRRPRAVGSHIISNGNIPKVGVIWVGTSQKMGMMCPEGGCIKCGDSVLRTGIQMLVSTGWGEGASNISNVGLKAGQQ